MSVRLDACHFDHFRPALHFAVQERAECLRRRGHRDHALADQPLAHVGVFEFGAHGVLQLGHDVLGHAGRRDQAQPGIAVETGQARLGERRVVGIGRRAGQAGGGDQLQLAGLDVRLGRQGVDEHGRHRAADHVRQGLRAAAIRHVHQLDAGVLLQQLARQVVRLADPGRAIGQGARLGLGQGDEFLQVGRRHGRIDHQEVGQLDHLRDVGKVAPRVVGQLVVDVGVDGMAGGHRPQRVAVARHARQRGGGDRAAAARQVLGHRRLSQPFESIRRRARDGVQDAPGRRGNNDLDGLGRIGLLGVCLHGRHGQGGQQRAGQPGRDARKRCSDIHVAS